MMDNTRTERPGGAADGHCATVPDVEIRFLRPLGVTVAGMRLNTCTGGLRLRPGEAPQRLDEDMRPVADQA